MERRTDVLLTEYGHAVSRTRAAELIKAGRVTLRGAVVSRAGVKVDDCGLRESDFAVTPLPAGMREYVSRGGYKLEHALREFAVTAENMRVCIDCGASTGGFTDCLLQHGAERVYAVDVGTAQLCGRLRGDRRVIVCENTDARNLHSVVPCDGGADLITADLSFISLKHVFAVFRPYNCPVIALVKPQFETGGGVRMKGGVLKDERVLARVAADVTAFAEAAGFCVAGIVDVPYVGSDKNREKLMLLK